MGLELSSDLTQMEGVADEDVVCRGSERTVAFARDAAGRAPAKEFLTSGSVSAAEQIKLKAIFERMGDHGKINNTEIFRKESDKVYAFKYKQVRITAYLDKGIWFLLHGFIKKGMKWKATDSERAERIRQEHLNRRQQRR